MLEFIHVEKKFQEDFWSKPINVLEDLSFKVSEGSLCGFLGANGAGKTTSIKTLLKFIKPSKGKVVYSEKLGRTWREIRSKIGYFPERPFFYPTMTGRDFCLYMGRLSQLRESELKHNLKVWSKKININYALDKKIRNYSKGMLQRLGFVASVIHNPRFVILDEPLSGLDPVGRRDFKDALIDLHRSGVTIFFSSHIVHDVEEICNQLVVIEKGTAVYCGTKNDLLKKKSSDSFTITLNATDKINNMKELTVIYRDRDIVKASFLGKDKKEILKFISENDDLDLFEVTSSKMSLEDIVYSGSTF